MRALADRADLIEQLHACPYCSDRRNHRVTSRGRLRIVRCRGCGLIYADRRWNRAGMVAYYSEGYFTGKVHGAHQDYLAEEREKLVDFREKLRSIRRHAPDLPIGLCLEEPELWRACGLDPAHPTCNCIW